MKVNDTVRCIWTQRGSKAYAKYGPPASRYDQGQVTAIHELHNNTVTIVQFQTEVGVKYAHIQNLL